MSREMKHSGIEWIGQIPKNWIEVPFKAYFTTGKGLSFTKADLTPQGHAVVSYGQVHSKANTGTRLDDSLLRYVPDSITENGESSRMNKGDFIFADTSEDLEGCGNCVYVDRDIELYAGYHSVTAKPKVQYNNKFFAYYFQAPCWRNQIRSRVTGIKVFSISQSIINKTWLFVPPLLTQQKIADHLDKVCSDIDDMITLQEQMIEELKSYKQSVITETVTRGLNPKTPMHKSDIDWVGEIPEHWGMQKMSRVCTVITDFVASGSFESLRLNVPYLDEPDYAMLVRTADLSGNSRATGKVYISKDSYDFLRNSNLFGGEIVLPNIGASVGDVYVVPKLYEHMSLAPNSIMFKTKYCDKFYYYYFFSKAGKESIYDINKSTAQGKFNKTELRNIVVCVPPLSEQISIVSYLDEKCSKIDSLIALKQAKIDELKEYKKSIIYEFVTGKKEVPYGD